MTAVFNLVLFALVALAPVGILVYGRRILRWLSVPPGPDFHPDDPDYGRF